MLQEENVSFHELQVEKYVADLQLYWEDNKPVFKLDSVSFLYLWGSLITWAVIALLCLLVGILSYAALPAKLPVQWDGGIATSFVDKHFIFAYPLACFLIRFLVKPVIYVKLFMSRPYGELITEYLSNYLCFLALSVELFSVLFVQGLLKSVLPVLFADTVVLVGVLLIGIAKMGSSRKEAVK